MEQASQIPNPLLQLHQQSELTETQPYGAVEIVTTYGEPQAEYAALHKSAGMIDLPFRGALELTGRDRLPFLNGIVSNLTWDKQSKTPMPAGTWVSAFLLNLKGRIVAEMSVLDLGDATLVETDVTLVEPLRDVFERYLFAEQVRMRPLIGAMHRVSLYGPRALEVLGREDGSVLPAGKPAQWAGRVQVGPAGCIAWRDTPTGTDGVNLLVPTESVGAVWELLMARYGQSPELGRRDLRPVGWAAFNTCRIEAGTPLFGIDYAGAAPATAYPQKKLRDEATDDAAPGILPAEVGPRAFARSVNLTKCYVGQEVVARMHARQQVARQIVGLRVNDGDWLPMAGSPVFDAAQAQVGVVTSSTLSPVRSNAALCLAFVKKPHFAPGATLHVPAEGAIRPVTVVETPFAA